MITYAVVSTKGGVGKTTLSANFGAILADLGLRVLLVDADVQPSLSRYFEVTHRAPHGLSHVVMSGIVTEDCISQLSLRPSNTALARLPAAHPQGKLDLIASDGPEGMLQLWLRDRPERASRIKAPLYNPWLAERYDIVIIDTQGAVGALQDAAVLAADMLISPVCPDILSAREFTTGTLELLERLEPMSTMGMAVPPMKAVIYRTENTADSRALSSVIREQFVALRGRVTVLETTVPSAVAYKKAATNQVPVHWMDPVRASDTMHRLCWELIPSVAGIRTSDMDGDTPAEADVSVTE